MEQSKATALKSAFPPMKVSDALATAATIVCYTDPGRTENVQKVYLVPFSSASSSGKRFATLDRKLKPFRASLSVADLHRSTDLNGRPVRKLVGSFRKNSASIARETKSLPGSTGNNLPKDQTCTPSDESSPLPVELVPAKYGTTELAALGAELRALCTEPGARVTELRAW